jgi:hypothetical protein
VTVIAEQGTVRDPHVSDPVTGCGSVDPFRSLAFEGWALPVTDAADVSGSEQATGNHPCRATRFLVAAKGRQS